MFLRADEAPLIVSFDRVFENPGGKEYRHVDYISSRVMSFVFFGAK